MQISGGKGRTPPTIFGTRKVESLGYRVVKKIAEKFNRLSRVHQRHKRQTTDRQTTDGIATAFSKRNVIRSRLLKMQPRNRKFFILTPSLGVIPCGYRRK